MITGVAGFIGSSLARRVLSEGGNVVGVDNLSQSNGSNVADLVGPDFSMVQADVRDAESVAKAASACDVLVHLAAYKIPRYDDALETLSVNVEGSEVVFRAAADVGARLITASTSDVYGKLASIPFVEDDDLVIGPPDVKRWAYAVSKMADEHLMMAFRDRYDLDAVALRFFGGYGPGENLTWWGGPIPVFIEAILEGRPIEVHGDGCQTRSFTFIGDYVESIWRLIARDSEPFPYSVINVGSTEEVSINELASRVTSLMGAGEQATIDRVPYATFGKYEDVMRRVPDVTRLREAIDYVPSTTLDDGLRSTIDWHRQLRVQQ